MSAKHTPGPWIFDAAPDGGFAISAGHRDGYAILAMRAPWPSRAEESKVNARLIAAAPELLAALKRNLPAIRMFANADDCAAAEAAIAKAEERS